MVGVDIGDGGTLVLYMVRALVLSLVCTVVCGLGVSLALVWV